MADFTWVAAPTAVLISASVAWWASQRSIRHQTASKIKENEAKKSLVFQLLRDEIKLRWKGEIEQYLRGLLEKAPVQGLELFSTMELKGDDVFTFKAVSASFPDFFSSKMIDSFRRLCTDTYWSAISLTLDPSLRGCFLSDTSPTSN
jgi:hypothetical protein